VAGALVDADAAMGIIPVGTLNHFARDMEIALDADEAAEIAASGVCVAVDTGEVNGLTFINNSVLGWYPAYHVQRERRERKGWSAWRAIGGALISMLRRHPLLDVRITAGELELFRRSAYILIANNEHAMEGFKPWQRETLTEGALWVYVLTDQRPIAFLRLVLRVLMGRLRPADEFERIRASAVRMELPQKTIMVSLDGEVMPLQSPLEYRSRPRSLKVMAPRGSRRVSESAHVEDKVRCES
jgi:diacylglycerol kinase family enzyme